MIDSCMDRDGSDTAAGRLWRPPGSAPWVMVPDHKWETLPLLWYLRFISLMRTEAISKYPSRPGSNAKRAKAQRMQRILQNKAFSVLRVLCASATSAFVTQRQGGGRYFAEIRVCQRPANARHRPHAGGRVPDPSRRLPLSASHRAASCRQIADCWSSPSIC